MSEKTFRYKVEVDTSDVARATAEVRRAFSGLPNQVAIGGPVASPTAGRPGATSRPGTFGMDPIKAVLGFSITGYGLAQLGSLTMQFGQLGAQQLRTMETFKQLGDQIGVNAEDMAQAVKKATNSSVSDMQAMQLSANILAQRFATNIDDISGDTAVLAKASRRLAQVYTDENGDLLSTEQVFARLVKFAREGNKELVDQFGISNQLIAETLGISTDGLRGAEGAENRWKGMVQILNEELARLGEPVDSTADRMEQAFARITTDMDKLRQTAAEPITVMVETVGGITGFLSDWQRKSNAQNDAFFGSKGLENFWAGQAVKVQAPGADGGDAAQQQKAAILAMQDKMQISSPIFGGTEEDFKRIAELSQMGLEASKAFVELNGSFAANSETGQEALKIISAIADQFATGEPSLTTTIRLYGELEEKLRIIAENKAILDKLMGGDKEYTPVVPDLSAIRDAITQKRSAMLFAGEIAPSDLTEAERDYRMAVGDAAERVRILEAVVAGAAGDYEALLRATAELEGAQLDLAGVISSVKGRFDGLKADIAQFNLDMQMGAAGSDAERLAILQGLGLSTATPEGRENALKMLYLEMSIVQENARLGEAAQREWMQTAKEVERLFESAADKIMGIPGVTSLTPVTGQQMLDTRYGVYENQPDEWVRRVRDELTDSIRNTQTDEYGNVTESFTPRKTRDYADVSREQVERLTGMAAGTPSDVMIPRLERKWESGSLFADPANLSLMNMDAIRGQVEEMKAGQTGRANQQKYIMDSLGISQADAALITGQQAPLVQMLTGGQSNEEIAGQLSGVGALVNQTLLAPWAVATGPSPLVSMFTGGLSNEDIVGQMDMEGLGRTIAERVLAPLQSGGMVRALSDGWAVDVRDNIKLMYGPIDSLAGAVNERLDKKIGVGLKIVDIVVARVLEEIAADL